MKKSYQYVEGRWEPDYKKEITFVGKVVMFDSKTS